MPTVAQTSKGCPKNPGCVCRTAMPLSLATWMDAQNPQGLLEELWPARESSGVRLGAKAPASSIQGAGNMKVRVVLRKDHSDTKKKVHTQKKGKKNIEPSQGIKKKRFFKACLCLSLFFPLSLSFLCSPRPRWEKRLELHHLGPLTPSFVPRMKSRLLPPLRLTISSPWQQQSLQSQGGPCYRGRQARKKVHSLFEKSYLSDSKQDAG